MLKLSRLQNGDPEIFASVQGEGISVGRPSVFIRLSLCNLRCTWCDTKYTWDWAHYDPKAEIIGLEIADIVSRVDQTRLRNVVITGGEPLLQQRDLIALAISLKATGRRIEIETNGTLQPDPRLASAVDQWNVSPKLASSGNRVEDSQVPTALEWFARQPNAYLKFVIVSLDDLEEVEGLVERYDVIAERVLLMPEGTDPQTLAQRSSWLVERCVELGYRYTTRLHVLLWGDQRGR